MKRILLLLIITLTLCMFKEYKPSNWESSRHINKGYNEYMTNESIDEQVDKNKEDIAELNSNQVTNNQDKILENTSKITELQNEVTNLIKRTSKNEENTNTNRTQIQDDIMPIVEEVNILKKKLDSQ
jgi:TolA-binding protein